VLRLVVSNNRLQFSLRNQIILPDRPEIFRDGLRINRVLIEIFSSVGQYQRFCAAVRYTVKNTAVLGSTVLGSTIEWLLIVNTRPGRCSEI